MTFNKLSKRALGTPERKSDKVGSLLDFSNHWVRYPRRWETKFLCNPQAFSHSEWIQYCGFETHAKREQPRESEALREDARRVSRGVHKFQAFRLHLWFLVKSLVFVFPPVQRFKLCNTITKHVSPKPPMHGRG